MTYEDMTEELLEKKVRDFVFKIMADGTIPKSALSHFTLLDWRNLGEALKNFVMELKK
jgi:hypothetical protein